MGIAAKGEINGGSEEEYYSSRKEENNHLPHLNT